MNAFNVLSIVAPFLCVCMYTLSYIERRTAFCSFAAFISCFAASMFFSSLIAVSCGVCVFVLSNISFCAAGRNNTVIKRSAVVIGVSDEKIKVLADGKLSSAVCVGDKAAVGEKVIVEWEKDGILFVSKCFKN